MLQPQKAAKLIEWFVKAAIRHAEAVEAMQEEAAATQAACLHRFFAALMREDGLELFFPLLEHGNPAVSGMAAVYAMREAPERCSAVLAMVAGTPGLLGFRAQAALERWDAGEWPR